MNIKFDLLLSIFSKKKKKVVLWINFLDYCFLKSFYYDFQNLQIMWILFKKRIFQISSLPIEIHFILFITVYRLVKILDKNTSNFILNFANLYEKDKYIFNLQDQ